MRICVIENNDLLRKALADCLSEMGHDVSVAGDGQTGAELALASNPDVVLTDMRLPQLSGKDVIARLRENLPKTLIVAMSATELDNACAKFEAERLGADLSLTKPFGIGALLAGLARRGLVRPD
jgi:DNA-binding response OmpR family regulator